PRRRRPVPGAVGPGGGAAARARPVPVHRHGLPGLRPRDRGGRACDPPAGRLADPQLRGRQLVLQVVLALWRARGRADRGRRQRRRGAPRAVADQAPGARQLLQPLHPRRGAGGRRAHRSGAARAVGRGARADAHAHPRPARGPGRAPGRARGAAVRLHPAPGGDVLVLGPVARAGRPAARRVRHLRRRHRPDLRGGAERPQPRLRGQRGGRGQLTAPGKRWLRRKSSAVRDHDDRPAPALRAPRRLRCMPPIPAPASMRARRPALPLRLRACALAVALALPALAAAEDAADAVTLDRLQVTTARLRDVPAFEVPASVTTIALDGDAAGQGVALAEALAGVPGLAARERQNFAQDTQLSIRGFGARSTFGVRGLRLYADGIPATMPDGQGQVSHVVMAGAERIEVMRGPFSALHGNSSGGVVQVTSAEGQAPTRGHLQASIGRDDARALTASLRGAGDVLGYALAASRFQTDGWRDHSAAERSWLNRKLHTGLPGDGRLVLVGNHFDAPDALDPLGLDWDQLQADPRQATGVAHQFNTRKSARQDQLGLRWEQPLGGGHALEAMAYAGQRDIEQFLAIPAGAQANPLHSGGVIDLDNDYGGLDLRWRWGGSLAGRTVEFTAGANADRQRQHRRGYENFV